MAKAKNLLVLVGIGAVLLVAGYFGAQFMAKNMAEQKVREFFAGMEDVAHAEYGEVEVSLFSHEAVIHDLKVAIMGGKTIEVREFVLSRYEEKDGLAHAVTASFNGVVLPVTPEYFGESTEQMLAMGYDMLYCDYAMDYAYDEKTKLLDLADLSLHLREAGRLTMTLQMENVDLADLSKGGPSAMLVAIRGASLSYEDDSLFPRLLDYVAGQENVGVEELVGQICTGLDGEVERVRSSGDEFAASVLEQIRAFIVGQKAVSVRLAPAEPVAVLQLLGMQETSAIVNTLGVQVEGR